MTGDKVYFLQNYFDPLLDYVNLTLTYVKLRNVLSTSIGFGPNKKIFLSDLSDRFVLNLCVRFFISNNLGNSSGQLTPLLGFIS